LGSISSLPSRVARFFNCSPIPSKSWQAAIYGIRLSHSAEMYIMAGTRFNSPFILWSIVCSVLDMETRNTSSMGRTWTNKWWTWLSHQEGDEEGRGVTLPASHSFLLRNSSLKWPMNPVVHQIAGSYQIASLKKSDTRKIWP
jgi:hypothetical protein